MSDSENLKATSSSEPPEQEENVVPLGEKIAVGTGGLPFWMGNVVVQSTAQPFYVMMLAVNPDLTPDDIDMLLAGTHPATTTTIRRPRLSRTLETFARRRVRRRIPRAPSRGRFERRSGR